MWERVFVWTHAHKTYLVRMGFRFALCNDTPSKKPTPRTLSEEPNLLMQNLQFAQLLARRSTFCLTEMLGQVLFFQLRPSFRQIKRTFVFSRVVLCSLFCAISGRPFPCLFCAQAFVPSRYLHSQTINLFQHEQKR